MTEDFPDIPAFLRIPQEERNAAWARNPPKPMPTGFGGRVMTDTEKLYRASIEREKAAKRALDEPRFEEMRLKEKKDKAERDAVATAVEIARNEDIKPKGVKPKRLATRKRRGN